MTLGCGFVTNLWAGSPLRRACVLVALFLPLLCVVAAPSVHAQTFGLEDSEGVGEATALPDPDLLP